MSCFGGREEQLYMLEVTVNRLTLAPDQIKDNEISQLLIKIKFTDSPVLQISRNEFERAEQSPADTTDGSIEFNAGTCCLFTKQPRDLLRELRSDPLKIGIFWPGDTFPIAETRVPLSGCLCDQVAMAMNDPGHLPKPYTSRGAFRLSDLGNNPCGTLNLDLLLTCFGKSITTHFQLAPTSFLFKNDGDESEFRVSRFLSPENRAAKTSGMTMDGTNAEATGDHVDNAPSESVNEDDRGSVTEGTAEKRVKKKKSKENKDKKRKRREKKDQM